MKKTLLVALAVLLTFGFVNTLFAQELQSPGTEVGLAMAKAKVKEFTGEVLSHDVKCHCVVVKTANGTLTLQDDYAKLGEYDRTKPFPPVGGGGQDRDPYRYVDTKIYNRAQGLKVGSKVSGEYKTVDSINYALSFDYTEYSQNSQ